MSWLIQFIWGGEKKIKIKPLIASTQIHYLQFNTSERLQETYRGIPHIEQNADVWQVWSCPYVVVSSLTHSVKMKFVFGSSWDTLRKVQLQKGEPQTTF